MPNGFGTLAPGAIPMLPSDMSDEDYNSTWVRSVAPQGRTDDQMRALYPDLDVYRLPGSSMMTYHKRRKLDLTS